MERRNRYRNYISLQAVVMVGVWASRQMITSPAVVTLVSSLIFLASACFIIFWELRQKDGRQYVSLYFALVFILFGIVPVLVLRIMEWSSPFDLVGFFSITGTQLERGGQILFGAMLLGHFIDSTRMRLRQQNP